jgi:dTDP-4-dehydrorhamnose 3,5-epimerase
MPFTFHKLSIPELVLIKPKIFPDERGFFMEFFKASDFTDAGLPMYFGQDNVSYSQKGVIRGLHFQKEPQAQAKLVSVVKGIIWDVAVDIRRESPNFLQWAAVELSDENRHMLYIPPGFAHGFAALSNAHVIYKCTNEYNPLLDAGIRWNDPDINIQWPLDKPVLSGKDAALPFLNRTLF